MSTHVEVAGKCHYNYLSTKTRRDGKSSQRDMGTLPLSFKKQGVVERHQVEGTDPSDRYFSRSVLVSRTGSGYAAKVSYEALAVEGSVQSTISAAVRNLMEKLNGLGFRSLRTRPNFKGRRYLAEKETWVDYPDPT